MKYALILTLLAALTATALPARATDDELPQGLQSARFLPGWTDAEGNRIAALELVLEPGWKTYWRSPGDAGLPPEFDWRGSNIGGVEFHWPAPELFQSSGMRTLGYHDRLVLPFTVRPETAGKEIGISAEILFGLCENICIPAQLSLAATPAQETPDPAIQAALARTPELSPMQPPCVVGEIEDGMTLTMTVPEPGADMAVEYAADRQVWTSAPEFNTEGTEITVDFVAPSGKPFPLDPGAVVTTMLGEDGATEFRGCAAG